MDGGLGVLGTRMIMISLIERVSIKMFQLTYSSISRPPVVVWYMLAAERREDLTAALT
jgi:hypothetical protein